MKLNIAGKEIEINDDTLKTALESGEVVTVQAPLVIRTTEEDETFKNNLRNEAKQTGVEVTIKEWRDKLGLDFQGKNMDSFTEAFKNKVLTDAKIEPEEKLKNVLKDLDTLKASNQSLIAEKEQVQRDFVGFKNNFIVQDELSKVIPSNTILPREDMVTLIKNKFEFEVQDNKTLVKKNGEVLKNTTTLEPLTAKDVLDTFFTENPTYLKPLEGGSGGSDSTGGQTKQSIDKFIEEMQGKGVSLNSPAFNSELDARMKAGLVEA